MAKNDVREKFTKIGCVMEDASIVALQWKPGDQIPLRDRLEQIRAANQEISSLLSQIEKQLGHSA